MADWTLSKTAVHVCPECNKYVEDGHTRDGKKEACVNPATFPETYAPAVIVELFDTAAVLEVIKRVRGTWTLTINLDNMAMGFGAEGWRTSPRWIAHIQSVVPVIPAMNDLIKTFDPIATKRSNANRSAQIIVYENALKFVDKDGTTPIGSQSWEFPFSTITRRMLKDMYFVEDQLCACGYAFSLERPCSCTSVQLRNEAMVVPGTQRQTHWQYAP